MEILKTPEGKKNEKQLNFNLQLAIINCQTSRNVCNDFQVQGYPALHLFFNGRIVEKYNGKRDLASLEKFVEKYVKPIGMEVLEDSVVEAAAEEEKCSMDGPSAACSDDKPTPEDPNFEPRAAPKALTTESQVQLLTPKNFALKVAEPLTFTFVKFYASWCKHCQAVESIWKLLSVTKWSEPVKKLIDDGFLILKIAKFECSDKPDHQQICQQENVKGMPTFKTYFEGDLMDKYEGGRDYVSLVRFVEQSVRILVEEGMVFEEDGKAEEFVETAEDLEDADDTENPGKFADPSQPTDEEILELMAELKREQEIEDMKKDTKLVEPDTAFKAELNKKQMTQSEFDEIASIYDDAADETAGLKKEADDLGESAGNSVSAEVEIAENLEKLSDDLEELKKLKAKMMENDPEFAEEVEALDEVFGDQHYSEYYPTEETQFDGDLKGSETPKNQAAEETKPSSDTAEEPVLPKDEL